MAGVSPTNRSTWKRSCRSTRSFCSNACSSAGVASRSGLFDPGSAGGSIPRANTPTASCPSSNTGMNSNARAAAGSALGKRIVAVALAMGENFGRRAEQPGQWQSALLIGRCMVAALLAEQFGRLGANPGPGGGIEKHDPSPRVERVSRQHCRIEQPGQIVASGAMLCHATWLRPAGTAVEFNRLLGTSADRLRRRFSGRPARVLRGILACRVS